ncbi:restin homolog [Mytilus edulis]|uniref:restin homolog n=1 Tax=Mytilus edulis TaxID=6550 RepID=UPI0039EE396C
MVACSVCCRPVCVIILACFLRNFEAVKETKDLYGVNFRERAKKVADTEIEPYTDLTNLLTSPPHAIALMGHLLLIATDNDFTLNMLKTKSFKKQFEYLKYPDSFRSSLVQLANIGWDAFNEAHKNMDSMKLYTTNINSHLELLFDVMTEGTNDEVQYFSKKTLKKIELIADECLKLSLDVEGRFLLFMNVAGELLEASTMAKGFYEDKSKDTETAIRAAMEEIKKSLQEKEMLTKQFEDIDEEIKSASADFKEALDDAPSWMKLMAFSVFDGTFGVVKKLLFQSLYDQVHETRETETNEDRAKTRAFGFAENLYHAVDQLVEIATAGSKNGQKKPDWNKIDAVRGLKHTISHIDKRLKKDSEHTDAHYQGIKISKNALKYCKKLIELHKELKIDDDEVRQIVINIEDMHFDVKQFLADAKEHMYKTGAGWKQTILSSDTLVQQELTRWSLKLESARNALEDSRRCKEETFQNIIKSNNRITNSLKELESFKIEEVNFDDILKVMVKSLKSIAQVRSEWGKIVRFFQTISRVIKIKNHENVQNFVEDTTFAVDSEPKQGKINAFTNKVIFEELLKVSTMTYAVQAITSAYVEVSDKHLLDQINRLGGLVALDPATDKKEIERRRKELNKQSQKAVDETFQIVQKKHKEYFEKVEENLRQKDYHKSKGN